MNNKWWKITKSWNSAISCSVASKYWTHMQLKY